jgi:lycopene beta-cyclase
MPARTLIGHPPQGRQGDDVDVAVVGAGPAGWALALYVARHDLRVALVAPSTTAGWQATYGAWADELPGWLPATVVAASTDDVRAVARTEHRLDRRYVTLATAALQAWLTAQATAAGVHTVEGTVAGHACWRSRPGRWRGAISVGEDRRITAPVLIDATGSRRVLSGGRRTGARAAQTAVGVVVHQPALPTLFMDWRDDHGEAGWPTFLYTIPLGGGRALLEETALARRPALDTDVLQRRLHARLAARGIDVPDDAPTEHVHIVVDDPVATGAGAIVPYGAAAPLVHPATGYSVAASLQLAEPVADAIAGALRAGRDPAAAARRVLWSRRARVVHHLRRRGLESVLALPPEGVKDFFEVFFGLPGRHQRAYLSSRDDAAAVAAAMWAVFAAADPPLRRHLVRWGAGRGVHHA